MQVPTVTLLKASTVIRLRLFLKYSLTLVNIYNTADMLFISFHFLIFVYYYLIIICIIIIFKIFLLYYYSVTLYITA